MTPSRGSVPNLSDLERNNVQKEIIQLNPIHLPTSSKDSLIFGCFSWSILFRQGKGAGTGTAAYSSPEEVAQAIATLNGCLGRDAAGMPWGCLGDGRTWGKGLDGTGWYWMVAVKNEGLKW